MTRFQYVSISNNKSSREQKKWPTQTHFKETSENGDEEGNAPPRGNETTQGQATQGNGKGKAQAKDKVNGTEHVQQVQVKSTTDASVTWKVGVHTSTSGDG